MTRPYPHLMQPLKIGKFILKNRMQSFNSVPHFSQGPENYPADAPDFHMVGDCKKPGTIQTANRNVYSVVMSI